MITWGKARIPRGGAPHVIFSFKLPVGVLGSRLTLFTAFANSVLWLFGEDQKPVLLVQTRFQKEFNCREKVQDAVLRGSGVLFFAYSEALRR